MNKKVGPDDDSEAIREEGKRGKKGKALTKERLSTEGEGNRRTPEQPSTTQGEFFRKKEKRKRKKRKHVRGSQVKTKWSSKRERQKKNNGRERKRE